ncbi:hypothetical protein MNBD_DELTA03-1370 [hydrothermal vent metagenome]|uniref:Cytochrome b/b6 N-terminal region profile domain-containing protein n=1 Tax=hydrothermal vent metagenome TaxID=652676 RepID=A0A3B0WCC1_9ZZZZ
MRFLDIKWGARSIAALYVSLFSGLVLALQYDASHPYYSVSVIDTLVPFGTFWRSLHFYSSQLFLLLLVLHFLAMFLKNPPSASLLNWPRLVFAMLVVVLLLFSGYILRADATGSSAGRIAENIILSIPILGHSLNAFLFDISADGMRRVYANHLIGLGLVFMVLTWPHIRRYVVGWRQFPWLILGLAVWAALIPAPMDAAKLGVFHITGPWFFVGMQEMLRHIPPLLAGVIWPALLVVLLLLLRPGARYRRPAAILTLIWLTAYLVLTIIGWR